MKKLLFYSICLLLIPITSCTPEEDLLFPEFSYTIEGETLSDDNYDQIFSTEFDIFQISLEKDGHKISIQLKDYDGLGVYDPFVIRYQLDEGFVYYGQDTKEVEITLVEETYIEGKFSGILEKILDTESKTVSGTFRVKIK